MSAFVGRVQELQALADVFATSGRPVAALLTGVPGSGKSRLLAEARQLAVRMPSFAVVGFESERKVPLAAAAELLRGLGAIPGHGEYLDALVFGTRTAGSAARARPDPGSFEPLRIFEAARRALFSGDQALLVVDDLQWVDDLSLGLCHYVIRAAIESHERLTILAATRPGGPADGLFAGLPDESLWRIDLGPLHEPEGIALAQEVDPELDAEAARALWRRAEGSPFWLETLARHVKAGADLDQVLTRRLRGAGRDAATMLGILALAERPISVGMAAELLQRDPGAIEADLQVLVDRGLVTIHRGAARPAHDLIRATAVAQLPEDIRLAAHRRLAARLERDAGTDLQLLRLVLEHSRAAGLPLVSLATRLATSPQRRLLGSDAVQELGALADDADPLASDTVGLHADVAALAYELGQHEQALTRWSLVAERAESGAMRARAALHASKAAYALGRADEARELLDRSRDLLALDPVLALEQTIQDASICLWLENRAEDGRTLAREATAVAGRLTTGRARRGVDDSQLQRALLDALRLEYEAAMQLGDPIDLLRVAERRETAARGVGLEEILEAALGVGVALRQNGRLRQAIARFRHVWTDAQQAVLPRLSVDAGFWLSRTLALMGELRESEEIVGETIALARRVGDVPRARHHVARVAATVWLERGRTAPGLALLDRELAQTNDHQRIVLYGDRAVWAARLEGVGATETVRVRLAAAEACAASVGCPRCTGELLLLAAEAQGRIGDHVAARDTLERRRNLQFPMDALDQLAHDHGATLALEQPVERVAALESVLAAAGSSPYRLAANWIRLDLGRSLAALGDARAVGELERAAEVGRDHGAETVRDLAEQSLRALGVRTWRRGATGAPLTTREDEVARLVAAGATNREVAAALFLSPKTVERHLVNLFRKLEVRNRTELAARLAENPPKATGIP